MPRVPVILLATTEENIEHAKRMRGLPVLTKPMVADQFLACVARELRASATVAAASRPQGRQRLIGGE